MEALVMTTPKTTRQSQSDRQYLIGQRYLLKAQSENFKLPKTLKQATLALSKAVQLNSRNAQAYISLGYLACLAGKLKAAENYLLLAKRNSAPQPLIEMLQGMLKGLKSFPEKEKRRVALSVFKEYKQPDSAQEFDALYDAVEDFILEQRDLLLQAQPNAQASLRSQQQQKQAAYHAELNEVLGGLRAALSVLERDLDVAELDFALEPLRQMQRRFAKAMRWSREFNQLAAEIQTAQNDIFHLMSIVEAGQTPENTQLESFYDRCDALADRLDYLSENTRITELEDRYNELLNLVGAFQDKLDL